MVNTFQNSTITHNYFFILCSTSYDHYKAVIRCGSIVRILFHGFCSLTILLYSIYHILNVYLDDIFLR